MEKVIKEMEKFLYKGVAKMTFKLSKNKKNVTISTPSAAASPAKKKKAKSFVEKYSQYVDNLNEAQINLFGKIISKPEIPQFRIYEVGNPDCVKKLIMRTATLTVDEFDAF